MFSVIEIQAQAALLQKSLLRVRGVLAGFQTCPPRHTDGFSLRGESQSRCFGGLGKFCGKGWLWRNGVNLGLFGLKEKKGLTVRRKGLLSLILLYSLFPESSVLFEMDFFIYKWRSFWKCPQGKRFSLDLYIVIFTSFSHKRFLKVIWIIQDKSLLSLLEDICEVRNCCTKDKFKMCSPAKEFISKITMRKWGT